jgi:hypothetical protein
MLWRSLLQAAGQGREADLDIAMEQTMFFLMHSCGLSREAQNEQSHIVVATTNHPSAPETSQLPPTSTYAPAASHLASSPTSPPNSGSQKIQQLFSPSRPNRSTLSTRRICSKCQLILIFTLRQVMRQSLLCTLHSKWLRSNHHMDSLCAHAEAREPPSLPICKPLPDLGPRTHRAIRHPHAVNPVPGF